MEDSSIELEYQLTGDDYSRGMRLFYSKTPVTRGMIFLFGFMFIARLTYIRQSGSGIASYLWPLLLFILLYLVSFLLWFPVQAKQNALHNERLTAPITLRIVPTGLLLTTKFGSNRIEWEEISGIIDGKDFFLLRYSHNKYSFTIIPKRSFSNDQEEEKFRTVLSENIRGWRK